MVSNLKASLGENMSIKSYKSIRTGLTTYKAEVVRKRQGKIIERLYRTFNSYEEAKTWYDMIRAFWNNQLWLKGYVIDCSTVFEAAEYLLKLAELGVVDLGKTEKSNLKILVKEGSPLRYLMLYDLSTSSILRFCRWRRGPSKSEPKVNPQTVYSNLATLKTLLRFLKTELRLNVCPSLLEDTDLQIQLKREKLAIKSVPRNRRPEKCELKAIYNKLAEKEESKRVRIPYTLMLLMAICTGLRISELVNLMAEDINYTEKFVYLRTYKGSGGLAKKKDWVKQPLIRESFELLTSFVASQNISGGKIFDFTSGGVTAAFRRVLPELNIENLRWHDLRREAVSQLIELQVSKQITKAVSRHIDKDADVFDTHYCQPSMEEIHKQIPMDLAKHPKMSFLSDQVT